MYVAKVNEWKVPLMRKRLKRAQREQREADREPAPAQDAVVYVHNAEAGVTLPVDPEKIFAVIRILGRQHKVLKDDRIMIENLN
mgnify:CR=1 FL=1